MADHIYMITFNQLDGSNIYSNKGKIEYHSAEDIKVRQFKEIVLAWNQLIFEGRYLYKLAVTQNIVSETEYDELIDRLLFEGFIKEIPIKK